MFFLTLIVFILILSLLILVHELGHFLVAKRAGIKVQEFGIGFPPRLWSRKIRETRYSINLIPFGGFVKMLGETEPSKEEGSFSSKSIRERALVSISGVAMNFLLAILVFLIGYSTTGLPVLISDEEYLEVKSPHLYITEVISGSPAEKAGFQAQDLILEVDGQKLSKISELQNYLKSKAGQEVKLKIQRKNDILEKEVTVAQGERGEGKIGVGLFRLGIVQYPFWQSLKLAFLSATKILFFIFWIIVYLFQRLFVAPEITQNVAGPVGVFFVVQQALVLGLPFVLFLIAQLSATLAAINLLPIPALDGSRLLFLALEKIRGRRIKPQLENAIYTIGFIFLLVLIFIISYRDIIRYIISR